MVTLNFAGTVPGSSGLGLSILSGHFFQVVEASFNGLLKDKGVLIVSEPEVFLEVGFVEVRLWLEVLAEPYSQRVQIKPLRSVRLSSRLCFKRSIGDSVDTVSGEQACIVRASSHKSV